MTELIYRDELLDDAIETWILDAPDETLDALLADLRRDPIALDAELTRSLRAQFSASEGASVDWRSAAGAPGAAARRRSAATHGAAISFFASARPTRQRKEDFFSMEPSTSTPLQVGDRPLSVISSEAKPLGHLLLLGRFTPAAVQRDFRWEKRECRALMDDFLRAFVEAGLDPVETLADDDFIDAPHLPRRLPDYYLGSMVLMECAPGNFAIFDGQQRITSCTALLAVLRDRTTSAEIKRNLDACIRDADGNGRLGLDLRDHTLSFDIQRPDATRTFWKDEDKDGVSDAGLRLRTAAAVFRQEIDRWSMRRVDAFARFLLEHVFVVSVRVQDERLANLAFETTNFRGLRLDQADALKSQIVDAVGEATGNSDEQNRVGAVWLELQREFGVREFERFLTAVDFCERRQWQGPTKFADLLTHLKSTHGERLGDWVSDQLSRYARAYRAIIEHETHVAARGANLHLRRLSLLPWQEWKAAAMHLKLTTAPGDWETVVRKLEGASFAILFADYSSNDRAKIFARALSQRDPFSPRGALTFNESARRKIEEFLTGPIDEDDKDVLHATVRWLEALHWGNELPVSPMQPDLTVEHILPLRPDALWTNDFPIRAERERLARQTGNLCLLPKRENQTMAGNRTYRDKRIVLRNAGRELHMSRDIAQAERWTPNAIQTRTAALRDLAWKALGLPEF